MEEKKELSQQQKRKLTKKLRQSNSVEEVIERGKPLGMDFTKETATEYLDVLTPGEPEKGSAEIIRELMALEDETEHYADNTEHHALIEKLVKLEIRSTLEKEAKRKNKQVNSLEKVPKKEKEQPSQKRRSG